jgi:hypothetical protein
MEAKMKKLTLNLDALAVDSFQATLDEKLPEGTVQGYATVVGGSCYETCGRTCLDTCGLRCGNG